MAMSDINRAELRRLLAEATPRPWEFGDRQFRAKVNPEMFGEGRCTYCGNPDRPLVHTGRGKNPWHVHEVERPWWDHGVYAYRASGSLIVVNDTAEYGYMADENARFIVAAVNALPGLLNALDVAESAITRVRELHYAADNDPARTPRCEECQGRAGTHPCGCWADKDRQPVCGHCNATGWGRRLPWPCPTIQALGRSADPAPVDPVLDETDKRDRIDCNGDKWHWHESNAAWVLGDYTARGNLAALDRHYGPLRFADEDDE